MGLSDNAKLVHHSPCHHQQWDCSAYYYCYITTEYAKSADVTMLWFSCILQTEDIEYRIHVPWPMVTSRWQEWIMPSTLSFQCLKHLPVTPTPTLFININEHQAQICVQPTAQNDGDTHVHEFVWCICGYKTPQSGEFHAVYLKFWQITLSVKFSHSSLQQMYNSVHVIEMCKCL